MDHLHNLGAELPDDVPRPDEVDNPELAEILAVRRHPIMWLHPGYILRVHLLHFLTHIDRTVDFTHPVSLIHGCNGSGKSSILQAIHFALGGKARNVRDQCTNFAMLKSMVSLRGGRGEHGGEKPAAEGGVDGDDGDAASVVSAVSAGGARGLESDGDAAGGSATQSAFARTQKASVRMPTASVTVYFRYFTDSEFRGPVLALRRSIGASATSYSLATLAGARTEFRRASPATVHALLWKLSHFPDNEATMVSQTRMKVLAQVDQYTRYRVFAEASMLTAIERHIAESVGHLTEAYEHAYALYKRARELDHEVTKTRKTIECSKEIQLLLKRVSINQLRLQGIKCAKAWIPLYSRRWALDCLSGGRIAGLRKVIEGLQERYDESSTRATQLQEQIMDKQAQCGQLNSRAQEISSQREQRACQRASASGNVSRLRQMIASSNAQVSRGEQNIKRHAEYLDKKVDDLRRWQAYEACQRAYGELDSAERERYNSQLQAAGAAASAQSSPLSQPTHPAQPADSMIDQASSLAVGSVKSAESGGKKPQRPPYRPNITAAMVADAAMEILRRERAEREDRNVVEVDKVDEVDEIDEVADVDEVGEVPKGQSAAAGAGAGAGAAAGANTNEGTRTSPGASPGSSSAASRVAAPATRSIPLPDHGIVKAVAPLVIFDPEPEDLVKAKEDRAKSRAALASLAPQQQEVHAKILAIDSALAQKKAYVDRRKSLLEEASSNLSYLEAQLAAGTARATDEEYARRALRGEDARALATIEKLTRDQELRGRAIGPLSAYIWVRADMHRFQSVARRYVSKADLSYIVFSDREDESMLAARLHRGYRFLRMLRSIPMSDTPRQIIREAEACGVQAISMVDILHFRDPLAYACFCTKKDIEKVVVVNTKEDALKLLRHVQRAQKLKDIRCLIAKSPAIATLSPSGGITYAPSYEDSTGSANPGGNPLFTMITFEGSAMEQRIADARAAVEAARLESRQAEESLARDRAGMEAARKELDAKGFHLKARHEAETANISRLGKEIELKQHNYLRRIRQRDDSVSALEAAKSTYLDTEAAISRIRRQISEIRETQLPMLEAQLTDASSEVRKWEAEEKEWSDKLSAARQEEGAAREELRSLQQELFQTSRDEIGQKLKQRREELTKLVILEGRLQAEEREHDRQLAKKCREFLESWDKLSAVREEVDRELSQRSQKSQKSQKLLNSQALQKSQASLACPVNSGGPAAKSTPLVVQSQAGDADAGDAAGFAGPPAASSAEPQGDSFLEPPDASSEPSEFPSVPPCSPDVLRTVAIASKYLEIDLRAKAAQCRSSPSLEQDQAPLQPSEAAFSGLCRQIDKIEVKLSEKINVDRKKAQDSQRQAGFDLQKEMAKLSHLQGVCGEIRKETMLINQELAPMVNLCARQIIRLVALRSRAENDMVVHFNQNARITNLSYSLAFRFPPLPRMRGILVELIDSTIRAQHADILQLVTDGAVSAWQSQPRSGDSSIVAVAARALAAGSTSQLAPPRSSGVGLATGSQSFAGVVRSGGPGRGPGPAQQGSINIKSMSLTAASCSGGEGTFLSLCFLTSCWLVMQTSYAQIDEWDVYMDAARRKTAFGMLMEVLGRTNLQCVLVTPNDVDMSEVGGDARKLVGVIKLDSIRQSGAPRVR